MAVPAPSDKAGPLGASELTARERQWVAQVRAGDAEAFEAMVREYADPLFGYAYNLLHEREIAKEIVQDLFLRIWSQRAEWDVQGSLLSYFFQSTRNRALDYLRHIRVERRFRERSLEGNTSRFPARSVPADELVHVNELAEAVERALAMLPARCREVFLLSREQQLTYRQIAEVLQISIKTVEVHMGRALAILRAALSSWR